MLPRDFYTDYILELLKVNKINLTDEWKNVYVPRLSALLQERVGAEMMPKLNSKQLKKFATLIDSEVAPEQWRTFWIESVPNFDEELKLVLLRFSEDAKNILAQIPA